MGLLNKLNKHGNNLIIKDVLVVPGYHVRFNAKVHDGTGSEKGGFNAKVHDGTGSEKGDIGDESAPNKSTRNPRVITVDSVARNKDNIQFETNTSLSDSESIKVTGSTSSRKDTRKEKYATKASVSEGIQEYATETHVSKGIQSTYLNDDEYEFEGEDIESFGQLFGWSPEPAPGQIVRITSRKPVLPSKYNYYVLNKMLSMA
uniref:Ribonuclease H-like domain-containing protein n=1 Tax=Tanacetum cinerariifolium TaxID=118510 RepID=A0A6L2JUU5_TANCI|nr:ribonuclease H-like domain-containing protein [Tanacetum cinerariifolium]